MIALVHGFQYPFTMSNIVIKREETFDIPVSAINEKYAELRLIHPRQDECMLQSMKKYGQLSPVIVSGNEKGYVLLDGFKRLRAGRKLPGFTALKARELDVKGSAGKAAILQLNWVGKSVSDFEEAIVVHSLYKEESLTQTEIAALLGRHKSWVCRRISLVERLSEEVKKHLILGLVKSSLCRELVKLPLGNQEEALLSIEKHGLTRRETEKIVSQLLSSPKVEQDKILKNPQDFLMEGNNTENLEFQSDSRLTPEASLFEQKLLLLEQRCLELIKKFNLNSIETFTEKDFKELSPALDKVFCATELLTKHLKKLPVREFSGEEKK